MSYQDAISRIAEITGSQAKPTPAAQNAEPSGEFALKLDQAKASNSGIPAAAFQSPQPVQNGKLVDSLFAPRMQAAQYIANRFGLKVTSDYRSPSHNAQVGGVPNSLHTKGLGFDLVGSAANMNKAKAFAESHPEIFDEVLVHNVGSGMHLHLGFKASN